MKPVVSSYGYGRYAAAEADGVFHPQNYLPDNTLRGVIWCHGAGGGAVSGFDGSNNARLLRCIGTDRPLIIADLGGALNWGNDTSMARMDDAYDLLTGQFGAEIGKVFVAGGSMGTITALNWAKLHPELVAGFASVLSVFDIEDVRANNRGNQAAGINTAYGGTYVDATLRATKNPAYWITQGTPLAGIPMRIWYSDDDDIAIPSIGATFAAAAFASGSDVIRTNLGSLGHTDAAVEAVNVDSLRRFFADYS